MKCFLTYFPQEKPQREKPVCVHSCDTAFSVTQVIAISNLRSLSVSFHCMGFENFTLFDCFQICHSILKAGLP